LFHNISTVSQLSWQGMHLEFFEKFPENKNGGLPENKRKKK